ncbi:MAG: hypothetical protein FOGNACKC_05278 [Anaerolineae bacterium]|nr:hypothetical protein [Anaerolineae bacterium]
MTSPRWRYWTPLLILLLAFGLRLFKIDAQSIWWDEGHSIFVASQPLAQIPTLPAMDVHPPAYFALLHGWLAVAGSSEFALRYLSLLFGLLLVALLWRFAAELTRPAKLAAPLAALLAAISPLFVAYSQEVRSYTMFTFLALGSTFFLWRMVFSGVRSQESGVRTNLAGYVVFTAACLYTHYFTIFLLLFQNVVWLYFSLATRHSPLATRQKLVRWFGSQLAVLLLFAPQLALAARQVTDYANPNLAPPPLPEYLSRSWQAYTTSLTIDPAPARWAMLALAAALLLSWVLVFKIQNSKFIIHNFLFLLGWLAIPLTAYFAVLQLRPSFEPRYLMFVAPAIFLLLAVGLSELRITNYQLPITAPRTTQHALRITHYALLLITLAALVAGLHSYYTDDSYFKDDSAGVARWLAGNTTPDDIIFVDVPHPFHYYADRARIPAPLDYLFVDIHTAADTLNQRAAGRRRLFWVAWAGSDTDPRGVIPFLAEKAGQPAGQLDFKGYRVSWFELPPAAHFSLPTELAPQNTVFGDVLRLDGAAFGRADRPAGPVWATLHFALLRPTVTNYKVSLRLRDAAGQVASQIDRDLLNDRHFRTAAWPIDDPALNQAVNVYLLPLPADTPPGEYQLEAVVYNAEPPYPAEGVTTGPTTDGAAAILGVITLE